MMQQDPRQLEYIRRQQAQRLAARRRAEAIRRERIRRARRNRAILRLVLVVLLIVGVVTVVSLVRSCAKDKSVIPQRILPTSNSENALSALEKYPAYADDKADISSECVLLVDLTNDEVVCEKNSAQSVRIASLTKIMTAIVAIENLDDLNSTYIFSQDIIDYLTEQNSAVAGFKAGEEVRAIDLLYAAMLPSGGDGAMGIADLVGSSQQGFVNMMNQKAVSLGMTRTHFTNATGFDEGENYSCAYDVSLMFEYALNNEMFCEIISTPEYTTYPTKEHPDGLTFKSTVYRGFDVNHLEVEGILGGKTGFTTDAGLCLVTYAEQNGNEYMLITLGAGSGSNYPQYHFYDAEKLYSAFVE